MLSAVFCNIEVCTSLSRNVDSWMRLVSTLRLCDAHTFQSYAAADDIRMLSHTQHQRRQNEQ